MPLADQQLQGVQQIEGLSHQAQQATLHFLEGHTSSSRLCFLGASSQPVSKNAKDMKAGLFLEKQNSLDGSRPPHVFPQSFSDHLAVRDVAVLPSIPVSSLGFRPARLTKCSSCLFCHPPAPVYSQTGSSPN